MKDKIENYCIIVGLVALFLPILSLADMPGKNFCYFPDPDFDFTKVPVNLANTITISADQTQLLPIGLSKLQGNVSIARDGLIIKADQAWFKRQNKDNLFQAVDLLGHVVFHESGKTIRAENAYFNLIDKTLLFKNTHYQLSLNRKPSLKAPIHAQGNADSLQQTNSQHILLNNATYTTCSSLDGTWYLHADKIELDKGSGRGNAHDVTLNVKKIPILYTPYFNFPLDKRRLSGLLLPTLGSSTNDGFDISIPYYWNIAPNYDATFTPHLYTARGLQFNGLGRYLTENNTGNISVSILPNDKIFKRFQSSATSKFTKNPNLTHLLQTNSDRKMFHWKNTAHFNSHWLATINYSYVGDDYYLQDFGNLHGVVTPNQLLRRIDLTYDDERWAFLGRLQSYQTLHPVNEPPVANQYSNLPLLDLNGTFPEQALGLNWSLNSNYTYFTAQHNPGITNTLPIGNRLYLHPSVARPIANKSGFFMPQLQWSNTYYTISHSGNNRPTYITRSIPIISIDSGLFFDRSASFAGNHYQQTLEPRLFYLYVPYHNQDLLPNFDSAIQPFSYDLLFISNRFSGKDRIGDANQISLAAVTRFLDDLTGQEKLRASLGQIYYFHDRKVTLTPGVLDPTNAIGSTSSTAAISPIAGQVNYSFNKDWNALINLAWDPSLRQTNNGLLNFQFHPDSDKVLNLRYSFLRYGDTLPNTPAGNAENNLNQASASFAWPFHDRWRFMGSLSYNLSHEYPQTYLYGLEYNSCCWAIRLVSGRTLASLNQNNNPVFNNSIYLQWQLKGLGNLGTNNPSSVLLQNIPGFKDTFEQL